MPGLNDHRRRTVVGLFAVAMCFSGTASGRAKVDVVQLDNNDIITCEVKKLERNLLEVKTDYMDTVHIEWNHVNRLSSTQFFEFETVEGRKVYGTLQAALAERTITVMAATGTVVFNHDELVRIAPIDEGFHERLQGRIDAGLNAKKANQERSYTISGRASYRTRKYRYSASLESNLSNFSDLPTNSWNDVHLQARRFLRERYFADIFGQLSNSTEQELDLRISFGAGAGRYLIQTNSALFSVIGGLSGNREWYAGEPEPRNNLEALIGGDYDFFIFTPTETDVGIWFNLYPNLSDWGRFRAAVGASIQWEIFKDFYWSINANSSYDNRPPEGAETTDWNFWTSLGYKF